MEFKLYQLKTYNFYARQKLKLAVVTEKSEVPPGEICPNLEYILLGETLLEWEV
jgi:hypothetical protein